MFELLIGLIALPTIIMSVKFWVTMLQWGLTNKRDLSRRVHRARTAFADAGGEEE